MNVMLYYSALTRPPGMMIPIRDRLLNQAKRMGFKTCSSCPVPVPGFDFTAIQPGGKLPSIIFAAILRGLEQIPPHATVYLCEDDVIYHDCHFDSHNARKFAYREASRDCFNYNFSVVHICPTGFFKRHNQVCPVLSMAWGKASIVRDCCERKLREIEAWKIPPLPGRPMPGFCYEPTRSLGYPTNHIRAPFASLDVRHSQNNTWKVEATDTVYQMEPGWTMAAELVKQYGIK